MQNVTDLEIVFLITLGVILGLIMTGLVLQVMNHVRVLKLERRILLTLEGKSSK